MTPLKTLSSAFSWLSVTCAIASSIKLEGNVSLRLHVTESKFTFHALFNNLFGVIFLSHLSLRKVASEVAHWKKRKENKN